MVCERNPWVLNEKNVFSEEGVIGGLFKADGMRCSF